MKLDLQDALMILGVVMMIGGVAMVHLPSAIAVAGLLLVLVVILAPARKTRQ